MSNLSKPWCAYNHVNITRFNDSKIIKLLNRVNVLASEQIYQTKRVEC